jgi:uncharacterized ferritin-like protein (DUF455 family)
MNKLLNFSKCSNIAQRIKLVEEIKGNIKDLFNSDINVNDIPNLIVYPDGMKILPEKEIKINQSCAKQLLHSIAHIEYNAQTIYADTLLRYANVFRDEKRNEFINDIMTIVYEETKHFEMLNNRLIELESYYGNFEVHDKLCKNCEVSREDCIGRICLISLVQESRGLDAGPRLINKLKSFNDNVSAGIIDKIVKDEVKHVNIGIKWFKYLCDENKLDYENKFKNICKTYNVQLFPPFNKALRDKAQMPSVWYNTKI